MVRGAKRYMCTYVAKKMRRLNNCEFVTVGFGGRKLDLSIKKFEEFLQSCASNFDILVVSKNYDNFISDNIEFSAFY